MESECFVEKHMRYQKSLGGGGQATILTVRGIGGNGVALQNLLLSTNAIVESSSYPSIRSFYPFHDLKISELCDGLFCLYTKDRIFTLVNPATTSRRRLPDPVSSAAEDGGHMSHSLLGIGRENSVSPPRYKLVWFFDCDNKSVNKSTRCKVFALDSNTWRYVDPPHCRVYFEHPMIHLDGVLYCISHYREESGFGIEQDVRLLAFDLHTETFQSFSFTPDIKYRCCFELRMCVVNHRLCIFRSCLDDDFIFKIWGLHIRNRSWEIMYSMDCSCFSPQVYGGPIIPVATINNHLILSTCSRFIWIVLYGSKTHIFHTNVSPRKYYMSYSETPVSPYQ